MADELSLREFGRCIGRIAAGETLSREETCQLYKQVILDEQPELQQGAFLMAHLMRGPTTEELAGAWDALDRYDTAKLGAVSHRHVCDIVGTGSDRLKTVNCSTPAAIIAAACGLAVAKKGARLVTGVSGASDILEYLGLDLDAPLERASASLASNGLCYLPGEAFLKSGWARLIRSMRFTSVFNIIGPLTRPCAQTDCIVIGAYAPHVCDQLVAILEKTGTPRALSPYGMVDGVPSRFGMDEFSPCGPTRVLSLDQGAISEVTLTPQSFGCQPVAFDAIKSRASAAENAQAIQRVLAGDGPEELATFFCINAAAALHAAGHAPSYVQGTEMAREALSSGAAMAKLEALVAAQC
ncbi:anthranilate phosphoribosyltransferase [Thiococcus pfennigii]|nr:anthranilate phosphoribosyltransferase [Thiococcus pfennigii]